MDDSKQQEQYKPNKDRSFWSPTLLRKNKREDFFIRSTKILFWLFFNKGERVGVFKKFLGDINSYLDYFLSIKTRYHIKRVRR